MDSDVPADHRACSRAYQPVLVAPAWTALSLISNTGCRATRILAQQQLSRISGGLLASWLIVEKISERLLTLTFDDCVSVRMRAF